jgi:hypothetical protein
MELVLISTIKIKYYEFLISADRKLKGYIRRLHCVQQLYRQDHFPRSIMTSARDYIIQYVTNFMLWPAVLFWKMGSRASMPNLIVSIHQTPGY